MSNVRQVVREGIGYSAASGIGLAVDLALLWILIETADQHYLVAGTLSFLVGTIVVYALSVRLIFKKRRFDDRRVEFGLFALIGLIGVLINASVLKLAVDGFGAHYLVGKLASVGFTFSTNFGLRRALLFSVGAQQQTATVELGDFKRE